MAVESLHEHGPRWHEYDQLRCNLAQGTIPNMQLCISPQTMASTALQHLAQEEVHTYRVAKISGHRSPIQYRQQNLAMPVCRGLLF